MLSYVKLGLALLALPSLLAAPAPAPDSLMPQGFDERSIEERNVVARQYGVQIIGRCYNRGQVAFSYDDGFLNREIDIANLYSNIGATTTFFVTGNMHACIYDRASELKQLYARGFVIGSHTWDHPDLTQLSEADIDKQFQKVEDAFIKILGVKPLYFRPPYGYYNDVVLKVAGRRGYTKMFLWTDSLYDYAENLDQQKARIDSAANQFPQPQMILAHSNQPYTYDSTKYALNVYGAKGYKFINANTCSGGGPAYKIVGLPGVRDSSWTC